MFRSLKCYRIHSAWPSDEAALARKLEDHAFTPCSSFAERSIGFEAPLVGTEPLARRLAGADLVQLRLQTKVLPPAAVKEALVDRVEVFSQRMLREPSRRELRELKEETYGELLPQALLKSDRLRAFFLLEEQVLAVATPTAKTAELLLDSLRDALGSLQATPLTYKRAASRLLADVFLNEKKDKFYLGRECRMKDASEPRASVTWTEVELADASVRKHVKDGLKIDRLAMDFDEIMSFTLDEDLVARKLKFVGLEAADDELEDEDPLIRHDAEFAVAVGAVRRMLGGLSRTLGGYED